jgi:hypothetical protein
VSREYSPIESAEQLVRHLLRWDTPADEIERRVKESPHRPSLAEWEVCKRLILQRRRYDVGLERVMASVTVGERILEPTEEGIAELLTVNARTVHRWRRGL